MCGPPTEMMGEGHPQSYETRPSQCCNRRYRRLLLTGLFHFDRQPTEWKCDDKGENQKGADTELESPAEDESDGEPKQHEKERSSDRRHGGEDCIALMPSPPLKPIRQPQQPLKDEKGRDQPGGSRAIPAGFGGGASHIDGRPASENRPLRSMEQFGNACSSFFTPASETLVPFKYTRWS